MITFYNSGHFELEAALVFGVSSKDSDGAFGQFGTGLKYAIAVCLREEQEITAQVGTDSYRFHTEQQAFRNDEFDFIYMTRNDEPPLRLGFTTHLGKNWKLWQAYRELYCNARDECGNVTDSDHVIADTTITVKGSAIHEVHASRSNFILDGSPDHYEDGVEIYLRPSNKIYNHGILVLETSTINHATYNITGRLALSEDRQASSQEAFRCIHEALYKSTSETLLQQLLPVQNDEDRSLEAGIDPRWETLSPAFSKTCQQLYTTAPTQVGPYIRDWVRKERKDRGEFDPATLTPLQEKMLQRAKDFLILNNHEPDRWPIEIVRTLGVGIHGQANTKAGKIYLALEAFNQGTRYVTSTLLEELIHMETGYSDYSRNLQTHLFDKIISLYENAVGEPL